MPGKLPFETLWTTCETDPLLVPKPLDPVNEAVIVSVPTANVEVEKVAWPLVLTATFEARTVEPWVKVTEPEGVPPVEVTVAVKVTDWPEFEGFSDDATVVEVAKLV
jgi:hypothetical protein